MPWHSQAELLGATPPLKVGKEKSKRAESSHVEPSWDPCDPGGLVEALDFLSQGLGHFQREAQRVMKGFVA